MAILINKYFNIWKEQNVLYILGLLGGSLQLKTLILEKFQRGRKELITHKKKHLNNMIEFISLVIMCATIHFYYEWSLVIKDSLIIGVIAYFTSLVIISLIWKN